MKHTSSIKKVCIVIDDSFDTSGGAQTSVLDQVGYLQRQGIAVDVLCPDSPKAAQTYPFVHSVQRTPVSIKALAGYSQLVPTQSLIKRISQGAYDIIHCQSDRSAFTAARLAAAESNTPLVHTFHGLYDAAIDGHHPFKASVVSRAVYYGIVYDRARAISIPDALLRTFSQRRRMHQRVWQALAAMAALSDGFTTPSRYFLDCMNMIDPQNEEKGLLIPNAVDPTPYQAAASQAFKRSDRTIKLITVARLDKVKRVDTLLRAVALLPPHVVLSVVGDGPDDDRLRALADKLGIRERVTFHGFCSRGKVGELLRGADIFLLSSYHFETQGVVLLEAAAAGLPIIYCDERLNIGTSRSNALLTVNPSEAAFSEAISSLLRQPAKAQRMGEASLRPAIHYRAYGERIFTPLPACAGAYERKQNRANQPPNLASRCTMCIL